MVSLNKKVVIICLGLLSIVIIGAVSYKIFLRPTIVSPIGSEILPTPTVVEPLVLWQDQSEFSFRYPASLKLDPHDEDKENYAHIEITSASHSGNLIIWTKDTQASDNDDWIKKEKIQGAIDTVLASIPAKKFLSGGDPKILTTIVVRNGYLYQIEAKLSDSEYWNKVYETVTSSFEFTQIEKEASTKNTTNGSTFGQESAGEEIFEGEEVIE